MSEKFLNSDRISELWNAIKSALSGKQNTLTDGTGTTIQGSAVNVTTPVNGIVTQAEFDALPEVQKNTGMYVVKEDGDGNGGGGGSGSQGEVYSTEETRIGTWIDGRPLYRISGTYDVSNAEIDSPVLLAELDTLNIYHVRNITALLNASNGSAYQIPFIREMIVSGTLSMLAIISIISSKQLIFRTTNTSLRGILCVTIEYTKTTDEPEVTS